MKKKPEIKVSSAKAEPYTVVPAGYGDGGWKWVTYECPAGVFQFRYDAQRKTMNIRCVDGRMIIEPNVANDFGVRAG